ncbi:MAG: hypothetical protein GYB19_07350 [Rhodospirillales bacterium]|nr:hypothetical protein [Rhodospirillales bacterium]
MLNRKKLGKGEIVKIRELSKNDDAIVAALSFLLDEAREYLSQYSIPLPDTPQSRSLLFSSEDSAYGYFGLDPTISNVDIDFNSSISANAAPNGKLIRAVKTSLETATSYDPASRYMRTVADMVFGNMEVISREWLNEINYAVQLILKHEKPIKVPGVRHSVDLACDAIQRGLSNITSAKKRKNLMIEVFVNCDDISFSCRLMRALIGDDRKDKGGHIVSNNIFENEAINIRQELLSRLTELSRKTPLASQLEPQSIFWFWWGCDKEDEVRQYIELALMDENQACKLLDQAISIVFTSSGPINAVSIENLNAIASATGYEQAAFRLRSSSDPEHVKTANVFLAALEEGFHFYRSKRSSQQN